MIEMKKAKNVILVKKEVVKWARESIGFSLEDAAKKSKLKIDEISSWENTDSEIKLSNIKKLAKTYKRTLTFFFLGRPPEISPIPNDFRTLDSVNIDTLSPKVRLAIRKAQRNRKFYAYLTEVADIKLVKHPTINFNVDPTEIAKKFRVYLNTTIEEQKGWKDEGFAFNRWIDHVEEKGVPVFQISLPKKEIRGFCLRENDLPPVIVLNSGDAIRGRIFT